MEKTISIYIDSNIDTADHTRKQLNDLFFYDANDLDATYLLRGKVAGMLTSRGSGNPLDLYTSNSRGLTTFEGYQGPLILVNGLPGWSMESIDPMDVKSIKVEQNIALTSRYGLRGSNGVIHVSTFDSTYNRNRLKFKVFGTLESAIQSVEPLSAETFVQKGGTNFGDNTNWWEEIIRPGFSQNYHLSYQGGNKNTQYLVSGNYRNGNNVLLNSDFGQSSLRLHFQQKAFAEKLQFNLTLSGLYRDANPGLVEAIPHTITRNPTESIRDESNPQWGGYSESFLFNYFNPVSILEQNTFEQQKNIQHAIFGLNYQLTDHISLGLTGAFQKRDFTEQRVSPVTSFWRGFYLGGWASLNESEQTNQFLEGFVNVQKAGWNIQLGMRDQRFKTTGALAELDSIGSTGFSFDQFNAGAGLTYENPVLDFFRNLEDGHRLSSYYGQISKSFKYGSVSATFAREGATRFGVNNKWANFGGLQIDVPLQKIMNLPSDLEVDFSGGYGFSGNVPRRSNLSKNIWEEGDFSLQNNSFQPILYETQLPNPDLKSSMTKELNLGLSVTKNNWRAKLNYFSRRSDNLIDLQTSFSSFLSPFGFSDTQYVNGGASKSSGIELDISGILLPDYEHLRWTTGVQIFAYQSKVETKLNSVRTFDPFIKGLGVFTTGEVGTVSGLVVESLISNEFQYADIDNDGLICQCESDYAALESTLPNFNFSWQNHIRFKKLEIQFSLYASVGHHLISEGITKNSFGRAGVYNVPRLIYETELENVTNAFTFSDYFLEEATFLRLEHLTFRYPFILKNRSQLKAFIGFNNLLTFHNYSGANPEVRQDLNEDGIIHGIDASALYPMTKSFVFGLEYDLY